MLEGLHVCLALVKPSKQKRQRFVGRQGDAQWNVVQERPDRRFDSRQVRRPARNGNAHDDVVLLGVTSQQHGPRGLDDGIRLTRSAAASRARACVGPQAESVGIRRGHVRAEAGRVAATRCTRAAEPGSPPGRRARTSRPVRRPAEPARPVIGKFARGRKRRRGPGTACS